MFVPGHGLIEKEDFTQEHYDAFMKSLSPEWTKERAEKYFFTPPEASKGESIRNEEQPPKSENSADSGDALKEARAHYKEVTSKRPGSTWDVETINQKLEEFVK